MKYDYLIIGCGFYGATTARILAEAGHKILILEKESYYGGHASTEIKDRIVIHSHGPHIFHTNNDNVWNFVNRFAKFEPFDLKVKVSYEGTIYSFPINLLTLQQVFKTSTYASTMEAWDKSKIPNDNPANFEEAALASVGQKIYDIFFKGYTCKQWATDPKNLSKEIFGRIPVRPNYDDKYFAKHRNKYQGIPENGYSPLIQVMVSHPNITVRLNYDFFETLSLFSQKDFEFKNLIYTGPIDKLFDYKYGKLPYRSLKFETLWFKDTFQGGPVVNYTSINVPYTRTTEHKFFSNKTENLPYSYVSFEYPADYEKTNEPFYPISNKESDKLYEKYKKLSEQVKIEEYGGLFGGKLYVGGRLGLFKYYDMDDVISHAMQLCSLILNEKENIL